MYAIIEVGAKQYSVKQGDVIEVEKLNQPEGENLTLDKVLLVSGEDKVEIGRPYVSKARIEAVVLKHVKGEKKISFKYKRRKSSDWKKGHRQQFTRLEIKEIKVG